MPASYAHPPAPWTSPPRREGAKPVVSAAPMRMQRLWKAMDSGALYQPPKVNVPPVHFYTHEMPAWGVLALNVASWIFVSSNSTRAF